MPEANKEEARNFLREFRRLASSTGIFLVDTEKTDRTLVQLGLTRKICKEEIRGLSVLDYASGPQPDINKPGEIWVFGKRIEGYEIYMKLKIARGKARDHAICLSFHIAERPLDHPFQP